MPIDVDTALAQAERQPRLTDAPRAMACDKIAVAERLLRRRAAPSGIAAIRR